MLVLQQVITDAQIVLRFNDVGFPFLLYQEKYYTGELVTEPRCIPKIFSTICSVGIEMNNAVTFGRIGYFKIGNIVIGTNMVILIFCSTNMQAVW